MDEKLIQAKQEEEYWFPYHYIPRVIKNKYTTDLSLDWGYEYLQTKDLLTGFFEVSQYSDVLEVGCGDGALLNFIVNKFNLKCTGVDFSQRAIDLANLYKANNNVNFICGDIFDDNILQEKHECLLLVEVLEHIPDDVRVKFINKCFSKLSSGGMALITVPHKNKKLIDKHFCHFDKESIISLITQNDSVCIEEISFFENMRTSMIRKIINNRFYKIKVLWDIFLYSNHRYNSLSENKCGRIMVKVLKK